MPIALPSTVSARIEQFTGRTWLLPELLDWFESSQQRIFLLTGGPGTGKSMIAAWLAGAGPIPVETTARQQLERLRAQVKAGHFCVASSGSTDPKELARQMADQLTRNMPGFGQALAATLSDQIRIASEQHVRKVEAGGSVTGVYIANLDLGGLGEELSFNRILRDPLKRLYEDGYDEPMLLLVDSLDEALTYTGRTNVVQLLAKLADLPPQVRILATTRPDPRVLKLFHEARFFDLIKDSPQNVDDVKQYVLEYLQPTEGLDGERCMLLATRLSQAAKGIFLYAYMVLGDLLPRLPQIPDLETYPLPDGLSGLYREFLNRELGKDEDRWYESFKPVLGLIAVAQGDGLTRTQLAAINDKEVEQTLRICKQYLAGELPEGPFRVFHESFADFLLEDENNPDYHIDGQTWHKRIADHFLAQYGRDWVECHDPYCLAHLAQHFHQANQIKLLQDLVDNRSWFSVRISNDVSQRGYVSDLDLAYSVGLKLGHAGWPALMANTLVRASLSALASYLPPEAFEALARIGRWEEATRRAILITDGQRRQQVLGRLQRAAHEMRNSDFTRLLRSVTSETLFSQEDPATQTEPWLLDLVQRWGAERTIRQLPQYQPRIDPDRTRALKSHLEVAVAAVQVGRPDEARSILGKAFSLMTVPWPHGRGDLLLRIANLLLPIGLEDDIFPIIEIARQFEFESDRVWTLAELALICADAVRQDLKQWSLEIAVGQLERAERRSASQFEYSKVALAMCKLGDDRAGAFLDQALQLAQRTTQPGWYWEEQEAWASLACALARCGLCDQAVIVAGRLHLHEVDLAQLVAELAVWDRWDDAWLIAQQLHPITRDHGLIEATYSLAQAKKLKPYQYRAVIQQLTGDLEQDESIQDRLNRLESLINLALIDEDAATAKKFFSQVMALAAKADAKLLGEAIKIAARLAVPVSDLAALVQLQSRLHELSTEELRTNAESATAQVALAFADLGEMEGAWSLAERVMDETMRLEVCVRIAEVAHKRGADADKYFNQAKILAQTSQNAGWTPTLWAHLARLAHDLDRADELGECLRSAIEGATTLTDGYDRGFNAFNCAEVAQVLHEWGFTDQAASLLRIGLSHASHSGLQRNALSRLTSVAAQLKVSPVWVDFLKLASDLERANDGDEILLEILAGMAQAGENDLARETLTKAIEAILDDNPGGAVIQDLGIVLSEQLPLTARELHEIIEVVLTRVRSKDRPSVLTWVAALLPAIARVDRNLAVETWARFEQADAMLRN